MNVQNEKLGGCNSVERVREEPRLNGDTDQSAVSPSCCIKSPGHTPSTPPPSECSPSDGTSDTNLDDRIRFALSELDFNESNHRTSKFSQPLSSARQDTRSTENRTQEDNVSVESDSSDSEDEMCPNEMGYMPLPQEPDVDGDTDCDSSECMPRVPPLQQLATGDGGAFASGSREDPMLSATPPGRDAIVQCKSKLSSKSDEESEGKPASRLKDDEVESIKKAMSGFSLPTSAVPEWAKHVPEDIWKSELMGGLHGKLKREKKS